MDEKKRIIKRKKECKITMREERKKERMYEK